MAYKKPPMSDEEFWAKGFFVQEELERRGLDDGFCFGLPADSPERIAESVRQLRLDPATLRFYGQLLEEGAKLGSEIRELQENDAPAMARISKQQKSVLVRQAVKVVGLTGEAKELAYEIAQAGYSEGHRTSGYVQGELDVLGRELVLSGA